MAGARLALYGAQRMETLQTIIAFVVLAAMVGGAAILLWLGYR